MTKMAEVKGGGNPILADLQRGIEKGVFLADFRRKSRIEAPILFKSAKISDIFLRKSAGNNPDFESCSKIENNQLHR